MCSKNLHGQFLLQRPDKKILTDEGLSDQTQGTPQDTETKKINLKQVMCQQQCVRNMETYTC